MKLSFITISSFLKQLICLKKLSHIFGLIGVLSFFSCQKTYTYEDRIYQTKNVIIIVMDGARYSETWGDTSHTYIPNISNFIAPLSVVNTNFYNNDYTFTLPGHLAMLSGQNYNIDNGGAELPPFPTILQYFNKAYPDKNSWLITSKDKLEVLTNTSQTNFNNIHLSHTDCGINGLGTGYREDSVTLYNSLTILDTTLSTLTLINFKQPDNIAHSNDWQGYLNQITVVDNYIYQLFNFVQTNVDYKNKTTVFIVNDHGRHDDLNGGFQNHGDSCEGCKHLMFFAFGPDFYQNKTINTPYELIDIAPTVAELLHFNIINSKGQVMGDLFK